MLVLCNFLRKLMVSNKIFTGFENSYNSYEQYPLEKFFIFTIYQNYTLALKLLHCPWNLKFLILQAHPVATNTQSGTQIFLMLIWLAHAFGKSIGYFARSLIPGLKMVQRRFGTKGKQKVIHPWSKTNTLHGYYPNWPRNFRRMSAHYHEAISIVIHVM